MSCARPPLQHRSCESPGERSHRLWDIQGFGDLSWSCRCTALQPETYHVLGCEDFSPSELSACSHPKLPLTSLCLPPFPSLPAGSALSPAGLCRGAAPGHSCFSASAAHLPGVPSIPGAQPRSAAQDQLKAALSLPTLSSLVVSLGLQRYCCETG